MGCGQSKERDFTTAADPVEHPPLSSLVFSCCVADQPQGTTRLLPPQGLWQSCVVSAPLHPPISPTWIVVCVVCAPIQGAASVFCLKFPLLTPSHFPTTLFKESSMWEAQVPLFVVMLLWGSARAQPSPATGTACARWCSR